jgi:PII-like signaling protein
MNMFTEGMLLRIYISESAKINERPAYRYLTEYFREKGFPGCTVYRGLVGFGHEKEIRSFDVFRLSLDLPVVVDIVDTEERIMCIRDEVAGMVSHGLVITQPVSMSRKIPPK